MITGNLAVASIPSSSAASLDRWKAVADRDLAADGRFVFAVTTTGIYCRPTCPSRRPRRDHVQFFDRAADAEQAGFRACLRCKPNDAVSPARARVEKARLWLDAHQDAKPTLASLARVAGLSPWHLQREALTRLYGVSPRDYAAARRVGRLKAALRAGSSSTDAVYEAGYGSPSRVYAEADRTLGMTPAAYRNGGAAERVRYAIADSGSAKCSWRPPLAACAGWRWATRLKRLKHEAGERVPEGDAQRRPPGDGADRAIRGAAPERRRQRAASPARRSARHGVPAPGVEGAAADPAGLDPDLLGDRGGDRPADLVAGGRARLCDQPPRAHRPLPSRGSGGRRHGRVSVGTRAEGAAAAAERPRKPRKAEDACRPRSWSLEAGKAAAAGLVALALRGLLAFTALLGPRCRPMPGVRYGQSIWLAQPKSKRPSFPKLSRPYEVPIAIVGGGLTGCATAYALAAAGHRVALFEADRLAGGATALAAGLLLAIPGVDYLPLEKTHGRKAARALWQDTRRAALDAQATLRRLNIKCDLRPADAITVARTDAEAKALKRELAAAKEADWTAPGLRAMR
jgi:methylphosphotriester-DNA--protein-cysteine methyltransferase